MITGVKAFAFGLGLKDEAFTLSLLAALLGDRGGAPFPDGLARLLLLLCLKGGIGARGGMGTLARPLDAGGVAVAAAGGAGAGAAFAGGPPLNGGMRGITMLIFFEAVLEAAPEETVDALEDVAGVEGALVAACFANGPLEAAAAAPAPPLPARTAVTGLRSTMILAAPATTPLDACVGFDGPMARASFASASVLAFSLIKRCFSSSLVKMGTKSSGIGCLSWMKSCVVIATFGWKEAYHEP